MKELLEDFDGKVLSLRVIGTQGFSLAGDIGLGGAAHLYSSYPSKWQIKYAERRYALFDPAIIWAAKNNGGKRWSEMRTYGLDYVFKDAKNYGLCYGTTYATKYKNIKTLLSVAREDRELTDSEMTVCFAVLERVTKEAFDKPRINEADLTLLQLIAEDLELKQIGEELGLTARGVTYRKRKLFKLLGVKNDMEAVRAGMRRNILK